METILNTDNHTFLVHIKFKSNNNLFICHSENIGEVIKTHANDRNVTIKEFCNNMLQYRPITKERLNMLTSFDTESNLILKKYNLI